MPNALLNNLSSCSFIDSLIHLDAFNLHPTTIATLPMSAPPPNHAIPPSILFLSRAFRAGASLRLALNETLLRHATDAWCTPSQQRLLLTQTLSYASHLRPRCADFHFSHRRCKAFARLVMHEIDAACPRDVDEGFVEVAARYCCMQTYESVAYVVLYMPGDVEVVLSVSPRFSDLGLQIWDAGLCLYAQIVDCESGIYGDVRGKRVLELGAGTGLCASAYMQAGAERVVMTDFDGEVVRNMEKNIEINVPNKAIIGTQLLDTRHLDALHAVIAANGIDTVVAADVTYDVDLAECMVRAFAKAVEAGCNGYLLATRRNEHTHKVLTDGLERSGMRVEAMDVGVGKLFEYMVASDFDAVCGFRLRGAL